MEEQFDGNIDKSETFGDIYHLAVQIDDANLKKLRQQLQQVRYEIAETQAKVNTLRSTPSSDSGDLAQTMRQVAELRKAQSSIVANINNSILNQAGTVDRMVAALSSLNSEMSGGNLSAQNITSYVSILEGAIARMTSVSKKSEDFKKLQSTLSDIGIDVNVQSLRSASRDVNKLREDVEAIDDTPVKITVDGQHVIQTVGSQLQHIINLSKQLSAELNRNVTLLTEVDGITKSSIITPSAYTGRMSVEGKPLQRLGSIYDIAQAQALPSGQTAGIPPNEVVRAAYFGAPLFWRGSNQQVTTSRNTMSPRGTSTQEVKERLAALGLTQQAPAMHQFGTFENSTFLNVSDTGLINKHFQEFLKPIDPTILAGLKTLESKYNKGDQIRNRAQIGQVIRNISADKLASSMDKAYYYQLAKMIALYQQDLEDTGSSHFYMRGRPSLDLTDKQLYILNMINQFGGTLQTSEISRSLGTGHYQGVAADVRTLLSKGLISRAIIPPFPIPSAGIPNMIAPQIMAANLLAPNVGLDAAMATTMIKPLSTTDLGKRVLAMVGMTGAPSNVDGDVFLNKFVDKVENVLVEKQPIRFGVPIPPDKRLWFKGIETDVYGENKLGDRIIYYMEEFVNNTRALKPEYTKNLLPFIPTYEDETGRKRVDIEALRSGAFNLTDINTAKYLNARSDIYNVLQTPHVGIDKIMQMWATPNRDVFTDDMLGSDLYRKSVLWWASGSAGLGVNPQLERYTTNPEQAIQHLNTLYSGYVTDKFLSANADAYKSMTGEDYKGFSHYERSIIIRAMQGMLTRAVPVTSGFDVATNEALRPRDYMSKGEVRTMRDMLFKVRSAELENLVTNVPDLGRIIRAIEQHNEDIMRSSVVSVEAATALRPTNAYPLTPDQMKNIYGRTDTPSVWRKYAPFWGATPGSSYEDTYRLDRYHAYRDLTPDPNVLPMSVAAVGVPSMAKQLGTSRLPAEVTKFRQQSNMSPFIGFSGRLPWNEILKYRASMGSTELKTPEAKAEFERLLANPRELMSELFWDEDEMIKETYGTMAVKTPLFYRTTDLPQEAIADLQKRTADFSPEDAFAVVERKRKQYERMKGTVYERPAFRQLTKAQKQLSELESAYTAEVMDWINEWRIDDDTAEYVINPYKFNSHGGVADFYTYMPASVDKQKVIDRMEYERNQGLMDPALVEQYARTIANFRTSKDKGRSFKQGIEALFTGQDWSREPMIEATDIGERALLHGFLRFGSEGNFDFFHKDTWDNNDFSVQTIIDSMGHDTSMMTDEDISKYLQEDPDFRDAVREAFMADQDLNQSQMKVLSESLGQEIRQLSKKYGHIPEFRDNIEDYVGRVMDVAGPRMMPADEGRYPLGEEDIFAEKPEELMSNLPGGFALMDVLKQVAWKEGSKKQLTIAQQKKELHKALIEWRKRDEANYYFSDSYDDIKKYFIDIDGTLLDESHDLKFKQMIGDMGFEKAVQWYDSTEVDNLKLNEPLVQELVKLKEQGHELNIWTNRGVNQVEMTKRNLGPVWDLFTNHLFREGRKSKDEVPGEIWDNEERFLSQGTSGRLVNFEAMTSYADEYDDKLKDMVSNIMDKMPIKPSVMPGVDYIKGIDSGRYSMVLNQIGLSPDIMNRPDFENIIRHETSHSLAYEKLFAPGGFEKAKGFFESRQPSIFEHAREAGIKAIAAHKSSPTLNKISQYLDQVSKSSDDETLQNEMSRLNPMRSFFKGASEQDIGIMAILSEQITMILAAYDDNMSVMVDNLIARYGGTPDDYIDQVSFVRSFVDAPGGSYNPQAAAMFGTFMPAYVNPSAVQMAMAAMILTEEYSTGFTTGGINAMRAGGPSYRDVMRGMRGRQPLLPGYNMAMLPMTQQERLYREFEATYLNRQYGPETQKMLPSGSELPPGYAYTGTGMMGSAEGAFGSGNYTYLGGMGGVMMNGPTGTMLGGSAGVTYPHTATQQLYNEEQVKAYQQRIHNMAALPPGSEEIPTVDFTVKPPTMNIPDLMYQISWKGQALNKLNNSIFGKIFGGTKSFVNKVSSKHHDNIVKMMEGMPDVSLGDPSQRVTDRGMEIPISYVFRSEKFGGNMDMMRAEMDRFFISLEDKGIDTTHIKKNVIQQGELVQNERGEWVRNAYGQVQIYGKARMSESSGKTEREFADILRGEMSQGWSSVNEQGARFENTLPRINSHMERFVKFSHGIGDMSWKFTTLQMAALGVFFSMMSIMSIMSTGIGLVTGGLGDLEGMLKAKAMAGFSQQFKDKDGNVITGQYIDDKMGVDDNKRQQAWAIWTDLTASIATIMNDLGINIATRPEFVEAAGNFINKLLAAASNTDNIDKLTNLAVTLFDTLGDVADMAPSVIAMFDAIAGFKMPDWVPLLGGKSALSIGATSALVAAMAMPILAGLTLLTKGFRGVGMGVDVVTGVSRWNTGRQMEKVLLEQGVDPIIAKAARQGFGIPGTMKGLSPEDLEWAKKTGMTGGIEASVIDDIARANENFAKRLKDAMTLTSDGLTSSEKAGFRLSGILDDIVSRLKPIASKLPGGAAKTATQEGVEAAARIIEKGGAEIPASRVTAGGSKWKWVGTTVAANALSMVPYGVQAAFPETAPVMEPANTALALTPAIQMATGLGATGAATVAAPIAVIASAQHVGGWDEFLPMGDRFISRGKVPQDGLIEGLLGLEKYRYEWTDTGEEVSGFTDYDWKAQSNAIANGMSEDPLNSKWTRESGATFTQTNNFNTTVLVDEIRQILAYVQGIARQVGL